MPRLLPTVRGEDYNYLLEAIARIATYTGDRQQQQALLHHADKIFPGSQQQVLAADKTDIEQRYIAAVQLLK